MRGTLEILFFLLESQIVSLLLGSTTLFLEMKSFPITEGNQSPNKVFLFPFGEGFDLEILASCWHREKRRQSPKLGKPFAYAKCSERATFSFPTHSKKRNLPISGTNRSIFHVSPLCKKCKSPS